MSQNRWFELAEELGRKAADDDGVVAQSAASYAAATGLVTVNYADGSAFSFPARSVKGLENASDEQLSEVELVFQDCLRWNSLDVDFHVSGIIAERVGFDLLRAYLAMRASKL